MNGLTSPDPRAYANSAKLMEDPNAAEYAEAAASRPKGPSRGHSAPGAGPILRGRFMEPMSAAGLSAKVTTVRIHSNRSPTP